MPFLCSPLCSQMTHRSVFWYIGEVKQLRWQPHTLHTYAYMHEVLRNVELINTPAPKDLRPILLIVLSNKKTPSQEFTNKNTGKASHTLTIKKGQVPWNLPLPRVNKNPVVLHFYPPTEPRWQGDNNALVSFLCPLCSCSAPCARLSPCSPVS